MPILMQILPQVLHMLENREKCSRFFTAMPEQIEIFWKKSKKLHVLGTVTDPDPAK
jgi:hypothetical protein